VLTVYEKPTCTKCRDLADLLRERGIGFEQVDFHLDPLSAAEIAALLAMAGVTPREALRTNEAAYTELGLASPEVDDDAVVAAMAAHPELLQRPIVVRGERAVLARPAERVLALLED